MTETTRKGWVMVERATGFIVDWSFSGERRGAIREVCELFTLFTRRKVLRRYKPVKCTMTITLDES